MSQKYNFVITWYNNHNIFFEVSVDFFLLQTQLIFKKISKARITRRNNKDYIHPVVGTCKLLQSCSQVFASTRFSLWILYWMDVISFRSIEVLQRVHRYLFSGMMSGTCILMVQIPYLPFFEENSTVTKWKALEKLAWLSHKLFCNIPLLFD